MRPAANKILGRSSANPICRPPSSHVRMTQHCAPSDIRVRTAFCWISTERNCSTLQPQGRKTSLKKYLGQLEQREGKGGQLDGSLPGRPSPCLGARFPCPCCSRESQIFLFVDTEGKWKLVSMEHRSFYCCACLLGTLVVTRRALTHSNCGI